MFPKKTRSPNERLSLPLEHRWTHRILWRFGIWKVEKSWKMEGSEKPTEKVFYVSRSLKIPRSRSHLTQVKVSSYPGQGRSPFKIDTWFSSPVKFTQQTQPKISSNMGICWKVTPVCLGKRLPTLVSTLKMGPNPVNHEINHVRIPTDPGPSKLLSLELLDTPVFSGSVQWFRSDRWRILGSWESKGG